MHVLLSLKTETIRPDELGVVLHGLRPLIVRLTLAGATTRHATMLVEPDAIDAEMRNAAASVDGYAFLECVLLQTRLRTALAAADLDAVPQLRAPFLAAERVACHRFEATGPRPRSRKGA